MSISEADLKKDIFSNKPISPEVNPNIKVKDRFNPTQIDFLYLYDQMDDETLAQYDQTYLKERGVPFSIEMDNLLGTEKSKIFPPVPVAIPETITNSAQWTDYISKNSSDPSFVPTNNPDEIRDIMGITEEAFNKESILRNSQLRIDERTGYQSPLAWDLYTYRNQKEMGDAGVNPYQGASTGERFGASLLPRGMDENDLNKMLEDKPVYDDMGYRIPTAERLFPGRPVGEQGPLITYERDKDGTLVEMIPFNDPGFNGNDLADFVTKELPAISGELLALYLTRKPRLVGARYFKPTSTKIIDFGKDATLMGAGAASGDFIKLAAGELAYDGFEDPEFFEQAFKESALIGAYATAGNSAAIGLMNGARGTWNFITGKNPPDFIIQRLADLRNDYQKGLKARGVKEGTPEATALFDEIIGASPTEIKKVMEEVTGVNYTIFQGEGMQGTDANFSLAMLKIMREKGFSANKTVEILENQIFDNELARNIFAQDLLLNSKTLEGAKQSAAELAEALGPKGQNLINDTFMKELDEAWEVYGTAAELGTADMQALINLGLDPAEFGISRSNLERNRIKGLNETVDELPGELGDDIASSRYTFGKIRDPQAQLNLYNEPTLSRLALIQKNFLKDSSDKINVLVNDKYAGLSTSMNYKSPLAVAIREILKKDGGNIFVKDKALADWFYKDAGISPTNGSVKAALLQMQGRSEAGQFGGTTFTFKEMHELKNKLKQLKNSVKGKAKEPSVNAIQDVINAIEKQQEIMFKNASKQLKNSDETIKQYRDRTDFGSDYFDSLAQYGERALTANNVFIRNLLNKGRTNPESMVNAMFSSKEGGEHYHVIADPLFKMLREDTSGEGFNVLMQLQKGIGAKYKEQVIEPFMVGTRKDFKGMKEAHDKWMKQNGGLLKSSFYTDNIETIVSRPPQWDSLNSTMRYVESITTKRDETLARITKEFSPFIDGDPETMILSIIRGDELLNASGGIQMRKKLAKIVNSSSDRELKNQLNSVVRADIYNQVIDVGPDGLKTINPDKLNDLLTGNYVSSTPKGQEIPVTFDKLYSMFLKPNELANIKKLNAAVQQSKRMKEVDTEVVGGALRLGEQEKLDIPTLGRLLFGPLNPYTYRFGWRDRMLQVQTNDLLARSIQDPNLLDKLVRQMNRKTNVDDTIRFLYSLDTIQSNDMARNLEGIKEDESFDDTAFQSEAGESPFRSEEYLFYLQEFMKTTDNKNLKPTTGLLPAQLRTGLQMAPISVPLAAAAGAATGFNVVGNALGNSMGGQN